MTTTAAQTLATHLNVPASDCVEAAAIADAAGYKPEDFEVTCMPSQIRTNGGNAVRRVPAIIRIKPGRM